MAGFKGQAEYSIDSKGRIAIPAKMRNVLKPEALSTFTITRGFERCIFLYPMDTWLGKEAEISSLNNYNKETRDFVRSTLMWAEDMVLDSQGRVSIPKILAEFAGITDKGLIIGALDHLELWNPDSFAAYMKEQAEDYESLAERVMGL